MSTEIVVPGRTLEEKLAEVARQIFSALKHEPSGAPLVLGLCGGRSVVGLLKALREELQHQPREIFERLHFFMVDERVVPLSDPPPQYRPGVNVAAGFVDGMLLQVPVTDGGVFVA